MLEIVILTQLSKSSKLLFTHLWSSYTDFMHQFVTHLKPNDWTRDAKTKVAVAVKLMNI